MVLGYQTNKSVDVLNLSLVQLVQIELQSIKQSVHLYIFCNLNNFNGKLLC